eukprot:gene38306-46549_t
MFFCASRHRLSGVVNHCQAIEAPNAITSEQNELINQGEIPLLPAASENREGYRTLSLGESVAMDELGPIIINPDGTTRRITNWNTLSKQEQMNSWRVIGERNKKRVEALKRRLSESSLNTEESPRDKEGDETR